RHFLHFSALNHWIAIHDNSKSPKHCLSCSAFCFLRPRSVTSLSQRMANLRNVTRNFHVLVAHAAKQSAAAAVKSADYHTALYRLEQMDEGQIPMVPAADYDPVSITM